MLQEIVNVEQVKNEPRRRWFSSEFFDLILWFRNNQQIAGFQLCYDIAVNERAITWFREKGFSHNRIDQGDETSTMYKGTPILVRDGFFDNNQIAKKFYAESKNLEDRVREFVYSKLIECDFLSEKRNT